MTNIEREFKFLTDNETFRAVMDFFFSNEEIEGFKVGPAKAESHLDLYFDTPDKALLQRGETVRLRRKDKGRELTLTNKFPLSKEGGAFNRVEAEKTEQPANRIAAITTFTNWVTTLEKEGKLPTLLVKTLRIKIVLSWQTEKIEAAFDQISFLDTEKPMEFEIELENKGATIESLKRIAEIIQKKFGLAASMLSKYERGMGIGEKFNLETGINRIIALANNLAGAKGARPIIIAVAGGSASGKTSAVAQKLAELLPDARILSMDDYYRGVDFMKLHPELNWDQPEALDFDLLENHLNLLASGMPVLNKPKYSFATGKREGIEEFPMAKTVIIEGLFALRPEIANHADIKVFVDIGTHGRLLRRLMRDAAAGRTNQSFREVLGYFLTTVEPMHDAHVQPTKENADIVIHNEYDPAKESQRAGRFELQIKFPADDITEDALIAIGAQRLGLVKQYDEYFVPKTGSITWLKQINEIIRVRVEEIDGAPELTLTYKGPLIENDLRLRARLDIPISPEIERLLHEDYRILAVISKKRTLFFVDGLVVSLDQLLKGQNGKKFIEFCSTNKRDSGKIKRLAKKLGIPRSKATKKSYLEIITRNNEFALR